MRERPDGVVGTAVGLPNRVRTAAATALIGFHSATCRSPSGSVPVPTKALEMKVGGKMTMQCDFCHRIGRAHRDTQQGAHKDRQDGEQQEQSEARDRAGDARARSRSRRSAR